MRIKALVLRIIKQNIRDKRTLALMMIAPLIIMSLIYFLFNSNNDPVLNVGVYNTTSEFNNYLEESNINVIVYDNKSNIKEKVKNDNLKSFIDFDDNTLNITYENSNPSNTQKIKATVKSVLAKDQTNDLKKLIVSSQNINVGDMKNKLSIDESYIYGDENLSYFDTISPILIGFFVFFFVFLISGISLLKERTSGTLDKLLATPIKRSEIVLGYLIGYGIFAVIQTIIVVLFAVYVLGIEISGSIISVLIVNIAIAFIALSLGTLLSTFANSEFQMMQFIPIAIVPQIFFSGLIPIENMATWLQYICHIVPLYYGASALQGIVVKGYDIVNLKFEFSILILFAIVFSLLNIISLKRYRKI